MFPALLSFLIILSYLILIRKIKYHFAQKKNQYFVIFYRSYLLIDCTKFLIIINES